MRREIFLVFTVSLFMSLITIIGVGSELNIQASEDARPGKGMPGVVILDDIADRFEPVRFDHKEHVDMADSCGECHHQHGTEKTITCRECHRIDPSAFKKSVGASTFSSCRSCHGASFQPENLGMPGLKAAYHRACFSCHREVNEVGIDPKGCTELCHERMKETAKRSDGTNTAQ
jgi:hypothetical protein